MKHYQVFFTIRNGFIAGSYRANPKYAYRDKHVNGNFVISLKADSADAAAQDVLTDYQEQYPGATVQVTSAFEN